MRLGAIYVKVLVAILAAQLLPSGAENAIAVDTAGVASPAAGTVPVLDSAAIELDRLTVTAHALDSRLGSARSIDASALRSLHLDLGSALGSVSGIDVFRTGGLGSYSSVSVRGSSSSQVQFFLDGVPLNTAGTAMVDISKIAASQLEQATVYKGGAPLELTGYNAGGIIDLSSAPGRDGVSALVEAGSFGYLKGGTFVTTTTKAVQHHLSLDYAHSDNDFSYEYDITPYAAGDNVEKKMDNQFFTSFAATYGLKVSGIGKGRFTTVVGTQRTENGIFNYGTPDSNDGSITDRGYSLHCRYLRPWSEHLETTLSAAGRYGSSEIERIRPFYLGQGIHRTSTVPMGSGQVGIYAPVSRRLYFKGLVEGILESYEEKDLLVDRGAHPYSRRATARGGLECSAAPVDSLTLRAQGLLRYEIDSTNGVSYFLVDNTDEPGFSKRLLPGAEFEGAFRLLGGVALFGSSKVRKRNPSLVEKFGVSERSHGRENLLPETRAEYEAGTSLAKSRATTSLVWYQSCTWDKIVYLSRSNGFYVPENIGLVRGLGVEWEMTAHIGSILTVANVFTFARNRIYSDSVPAWDGNDEPLLPWVKDRLECTLRVGPVSLGHVARLSSGYYTSPDNFAQSYVVPRPDLGGYASVNLGQRLRVTYRVENYLYGRAYEDMSAVQIYQGTPTPGRMHVLVGQLTI